ncbi:MAG: alpha-L-rhamnosidase N-terminal domain-containing protein [Bacteroidetes bacterium]|nr:alpha-L-rhamnosidase N-terminal domain-containing protein [Bacteroidota bacterium]
MKLRLLISAALLLCLFTSNRASAQKDSVDRKPWNAHWIDVPGQEKDYEYCLFRKTVNLGSKPSSFVVKVSGDNRYKLFVNGKLVSIGPARGDFYHWNYETVDLAPYLQAGDNVLSAIVVNEGSWRPVAQMSYGTGFILQGATPAEEIANTNKSWKCLRDSAYSPLDVLIVYSYYVAGPGEQVDMKLQPKNWQVAGFDDSAWPNANQLGKGYPKGQFNFDDGRELVPSPIPARQMVMQRLKTVRKADGVSLPSAFPAQEGAVTIPANTKVTILLDQTYLTNAYPTIIFSKGKGAGISMSYAEGLYIIEPGNKNWRAQERKGNRNEIEGKRFVGRKDSIISDGNGKQQFTPFNWRTYRYLQLIVQTKDEPLVIDDLYGTATGYPFKYNATFESENKQLDTILQIGWHTARLCSWETYMDCPYYEQLQYIGDTRIQAMVSYYDSGDDRLGRNAIALLDHSRLAEGITESRFPTSVRQLIPTFSLWWIGMLHDYYMYRNDNRFVADKLPGERQVLGFFNRYQQADGSLKNAPYWEFIDWANGKGWDGGTPPIGANGNSSILDMQLLWAYQTAAELESHLGSKELTAEYEKRAAQLKQTIRAKYWVPARSIYADRPEKDVFSQHANALAILTGVAEGEQAKTIAHKLLTDTSLVQASIYFKYYVYQALVKMGIGNEYVNWLGIWRDNIKMGMTTWAEMSDISASRSDCHAWGSSPNIELFRTVLGINSGAPGFKVVRLEPHLGALTHIGGSIPHPAGTVAVRYDKQGDGKWKISVTLPGKTTGMLYWMGKAYPLKPGGNEMIL